MSETNHTNNSEPVEVPSFSLNDLLKMMLENWYWFVLSVLLCMGCAYLYIAGTPKVYNRTATILVKDSRKGGESDLATFADLTGFSSRRNVDNEIYVLQSRRLMEQVVRGLNLTVNYTTRIGLHNRTLYKQSPIDVTFVNANDNESFGFDVTVLDDDKVAVTEFAQRELTPEMSEQTVTGRLGDTLTTPVGQIVVKPTLYLSDDFRNRKINVAKSTLRGATTAYRQQVQSSVVNKMSSIITISMRDVVPQRAEDVINALVYSYNNDAIEDKRAIAKQTSQFINSRLGIISEELGDVDKNIESFKQRNNIYDLSTEATRLLSESSKYKGESLTVDNQIAMAQYIKDFLINEEKNSSLIPATAAMVNAVIARQISDFNEMVLQRDKLLSEGSVNNPTVQSLNNALKASRNSIIASLDSHIRALQIQSEALRKEERYANSRIQNASAQEKEILSSIRQQKVKEELYLYLLQKREENELALEVVEPNARIIDEAYGSQIPIYPKPVMILIVAFIFGVGIPFAIIYLLEVLDTTIRGRKDIEKYVNIPFLGEIPQHVGATNRGIVVRENGRDPVSEAFRILRTNMNFMNVNQTGEQKVVMITSSNAHAGKTFVSTNLALTLALAGKKVLLVDIDLRRRSLSKVMGHGKDTKGITSYLSGATKNIDDVIQSTSLHPNLDVLYAGVQPPNPAEMLLSEQLDRLVRDLREKYDYILLDSVPAMVVADALIIDRLCDLTLYVVREGLLDRRQLPDIERLFREKKFRNMSLVLNGTTFKRTGYGYGYGYGYSYGINDQNPQLQKPFIARLKDWFIKSR